MLLELAWGRLLATGYPGSLKADREDPSSQGMGKTGRHDSVLRSSFLPHLFAWWCHFHLGAGMGIEGLPSRAFRDTWQGPRTQKWQGSEYGGNSLVFTWYPQPITEQELVDLNFKINPSPHLIVWSTKIKDGKYTREGKRWVAYWEYDEGTLMISVWTAQVFKTLTHHDLITFKYLGWRARETQGCQGPKVWAESGLGNALFQWEAPELACVSGLNTPVFLPDPQMLSLKSFPKELQRTTKEQAFFLIFRVRLEGTK